MSIIKEISEFLIDGLKIFSAYVFYGYYNSFWLMILFFLILILLDSVYVLTSIDMKLTDLACGDKKRIVDNILEQLGQRYWQLFPMRLGIILGSILIIDILNKGVLHA